MANVSFLDTLLLIALPASGKSEVRKYLLHVPHDDRVRQFHLSDTAQLDDFPYVHFMRRVDEVLVGLGQPRRFYESAEGRFLEGRDWGTLLRLVNQDYTVMKDPSLPTPAADPRELFRRIDLARAEVGALPVFADMPESLLDALAAGLKGDAEFLLSELFGRRPADIANRTLVIEFARGGPDGASMPLAPPHGYAWNIAQLSPEILARTGVLYIWVTPEDSRRKNIERFDPNNPGSSLNHSAPDVVMRLDYGCDDIDWLVAHAEIPNTIRIEAHGRVWHLPIARFDNRQDLTTFVRKPAAQWTETEKQSLHQGLADGFGNLWSAHEALR